MLSRNAFDPQLTQSLYTEYCKKASFLRYYVITLYADEAEIALSSLRFCEKNAPETSQKISEALIKLRRLKEAGGFQLKTFL